MRNLTTGFFRVMAMQETGEECCVQNRVRGWETANMLVRQALDEHPEWRDAWVEDEAPLGWNQGFGD